MPNRTITREGKALRDLLIELGFVFFRAQAITNRLSASQGLTAGKMSMLRSLEDGGPQTVPEIARARPVARQPVQRMANELVAARLAHWGPNPKHARSKLLGLTEKGRKTLNHAKYEEVKIASEMIGDAISEKSIITATRVLHRVREQMSLTE